MADTKLPASKRDGTMANDDSVWREVNAVLEISAVPTILDVVCRTTGMGFAAIAHVTSDRWITCASLDNIRFGLGPGDELEVETTICNQVRACREMIVIDDSDTDDDYHSHPTPLRYGFRSYVSAPIVLRNGSFFGTLCAIDPEPKRLNTPETRGIFSLLAELIARNLEAQEDLSRSRQDLERERQAAKFREEFVAILGHDLRNPIASILAGARLLRRTERDDQAREVITLMQASAMRMNALIDNVLDFARGRLGGGFVLDRRPDVPLRDEFEQVVAELQSITDCKIQATFDIGERVDCDRERMGQLLSNLLGNAITYGDKDHPVTVRATDRNGVLELSVANHGEPIPPEIITSLFLPFSRGEERPSQQGLGLGLYIASEVARAHGGDLRVTSTEEETRFTMTMPLHGF